jgi:hypothetical protein
MKTLNKASSLFLLILFIFWQTTPVYNALNDYGYRGKIRSIKIRFYSNIIQLQNKWQVKDSLQVAYTKINTFNEDGDFTKIMLTSPRDSYQMIFTYSGKIKTGFEKKDSSGETIEWGKYTYYGNKGFDETIFDADGKKVHVTKYILGENQKTKTMEDLAYNYDGHVSFRMVTTFEDKNGYLYKVSQEYKLKNQKEDLEFIILEMDKFNNPVKILVKKNGKPDQIRWMTIEYR